MTEVPSRSAFTRASSSPHRTSIVSTYDLPGVKPEDVEGQFENDELSIHGKVGERDEKKFLRQEYGLGDYCRKFSVGDAIDSTQIKAELKHGVLTVHLPKREVLKPKRIEVMAN